MIAAHSARTRAMRALHQTSDECWNVQHYPKGTARVQQGGRPTGAIAEAGFPRITSQDFRAQSRHLMICRTVRASARARIETGSKFERPESYSWRGLKTDSAFDSMRFA